MSKRDYKAEFQVCETRMQGVSEFDKLFEIWKEAQDIEIDEIESMIDERQTEKRCEGDIFEHELYKARGKKNRNTISSHFVQFFYKSCADTCNHKPDIGKEKIWKYVLKNAFNMDGCVGKLKLENSGYKYIFLLKEANDSEKVCLKNYSTFSFEEKNVNIWLRDWSSGKPAVMLDVLHETMKEITHNKNMTKDEFLNLVAYMNINKRASCIIQI